MTEGRLSHSRVGPCVGLGQIWVISPPCPWCCPFVLSKVGVQKAPSLASAGRFVLSLTSCLVQRENRHVLEGRDIIFHSYERCWKTHTKPEKLSNRQLWYMQSRRVGGGYLFSCPSCAPLL